MPDPMPVPDREFAWFLLNHARGRTHDELTRLLAQVVLAVQNTGKAGGLTLTVKITPAKNVEGMVRVEDKVKATVPELDRPASMFFVSGEGELCLDDPRQTSMFSIQGEETPR